MANQLPTPAPGAAAEATGEGQLGPRIYGVIDVMRSDRVAGWAIDRADASAALEVDVLRDGRLLGSTRAARLRPDLQKAGVGTGAYGFRVDLSPPVEPGFEFTLTVVARTGDGARAELKRAGASAAPGDPTTRLLERTYEAVTRLAAAAAVPPPPAPASRLVEAIERIELVQARLEAAIAAVEAPPPPPRDKALTRIVYASLAAAAISLAAGLRSLWLG